MRKFLLALAFLVSSVCSASSFSDVEKSVFLLYAKNASGDMKFFCTATSIGDHKFLTASHCVTTTVAGKIVQDPSIFYLSDDNAVNSSYVQADILMWGNQDIGYDYAILKSTLDAPARKLGDEKRLARGDDVFNVSGASGLGRQFFKGYISSTDIDRPIIDREEHINWRGFIGAVMHAAGGSSGSALFNQQGEIVGVVVGTSGSGITVCAPISKLQDFIKEHETAAKAAVDKK